MTNSLRAVPFTHVTLTDPFWLPRQKTNLRVTLPIEYEQYEKTGRFAALKLDWKPGQPNQPHIFWDSDIGKWMEAAAYTLQTTPDPELMAKVDAVVDLLAQAQGADGYLNSYYLTVEVGKRWTNLRDCHELYCAGHLIEGAVAYYQASGKRKVLDVLCRYADYIGQVFGRAPGQLRGYCGHEEIELALVKLYQVTEEKRYLDLAAYFVNERGAQPHYFILEAEARVRNGTGPDKFKSKTHSDLSHCQAHKPVREQERVAGHAVAAMYLYSGMADVARETGDVTLLATLERLWEHMSTKLLYVTGGLGSSKHNEGFTFDHDLPNETAYCETCASVALTFWAHRMLLLTGQGKYADVLERALYNNTLSGVSLDGRKFFYANPQAVFPAAFANAPAHISAERQEWFGCVCCPPNVARLLASVGQYFYTESEDTATIHLYGQSQAVLGVGGQRVRLQQRTDFPWSGTVACDVEPEHEATFTLALRIPGWCDRFTLAVNGKRVRATRTDGYARIVRTWKAGDTVTLELNMPVQRLEAHPGVRMNCGRVALQRGPLVYCLEEADNGVNLNDLTLVRNTPFTATFEPGLLGGVVALYGQATCRQPEAWADGALYKAVRTPRQKVTIKAVPYCTWGNRGLGEMLVWLEG